MTRPQTNIPICIIYDPGTYGMFLQWAIRKSMGLPVLDNPLTDTGSSHNSPDTWTLSEDIKKSIANNQRGTLGEFDKINESFDRSFVTLALHSVVGTSNFNKKFDYISEVALHSDHVIVIMYNLNNYALVRNNIARKIWNGDLNFIKFLLQMPNHRAQYISKYNIDPNTVPVTELPVWTIREFLINLHKWWTYQNKLVVPTLPSNCIITKVDDILHDFKNTLETILSSIGQEVVEENIAHVMNIHQEMVDAQVHIHDDSIVNNIIDSICKNTDFNWNTLSLTTESIILWRLLELGFTVNTTNVDIFPTTSHDLRKLIQDSNDSSTD